MTTPAQTTMNQAEPKAQDRSKHPAFGEIIALTLSSQRKYRDELYRRSHECRERFPQRFTSEPLPLPFATGNGRLG